MYTAILQTAPGSYGVFAGPSAETLLTDAFNVFGKRHFPTQAEALAHYNAEMGGPGYYVGAKGAVFYRRPVCTVCESKGQLNSEGLCGPCDEVQQRKALNNA